MENKLERKYGLFTAICMVVGIVIGSGVFFKAQTILQKTEGNMPLGILAWIIGGLIMVACILAFAAMAQKYEKVNGNSFLAHCALYTGLPHVMLAGSAHDHSCLSGRLCHRSGVYGADDGISGLRVCRQCAVPEARW